MDNNYNRMIENAIQWAYRYLGSTDYTFKCLGFVEDALEQSNNIEIFGGDTAKESADLYKDSMQTEIPPKGTFVFYNCIGTIDGITKNWGHVGLAIGDGNVIHTWDKVRVDMYLDIASLITAPGWEKAQYLGWVPLERLLVGYQKKGYESE
jgi:cell wall-associated NlpC family hydrolase